MSDSGGTPSGTVNVTGAGGSCTITLASGTGSCLFTPTVIGVNQTITGGYSGDATYAAASGTTPLTVKPTLDIDDNGTVDPLTDGLLQIRYLFGLRGTALISNAIGQNAQRSGATAIADYLTDVSAVFDIDGDGNTQPLLDGLLMIRYMFSLRGAALIQGAVSATATRKTAPEIEAYIRGLIQ